MKKTIKVLSLLLAISMLVCAFAGCDKKKKVESADDLPGAAIGTQLGTTGYIYALDYEEEGSKVQGYAKTADAILALTSGKIDCVILDEQPAKKFVEQNKSLKILDDAFTEEEYAICVAKTNDELLEKINGAMKDLKEAGVIDQITKNYIGDDTVGTCPYVTPAGTEYPNGELHMATEAGFEPYEYIKDGKIVGIDAEIAQAICDKLGYKLVIDDMNFDSIITAVQTGKADFGMAGMTITEDRLKDVKFSDSYATSVQVIIVNE